MIAGAVVLAALIFALAGTAGVIAAMVILPKLVPFADGPKPMALPPWVPVVASALLGALLVYRGAGVATVGIAALVAVPLAAIWFTDARTGLVPDAFTLLPLAIVAGYGAVYRDWWVIVSAVSVFVPFAVAAFASKGKGMGWGDAKLAAFGAAVMGLQPSLLAFGVACLLATIVGSIRFRSERRPIAFAPYLVAAIAGTIVVLAR